MQSVFEQYEKQLSLFDGQNRIRREKLKELNQKKFLAQLQQNMQNANNVENELRVATSDGNNTGSRDTQSRRISRNSRRASVAPSKKSNSRVQSRDSTTKNSGNAHGGQKPTILYALGHKTDNTNHPQFINQHSSIAHKMRTSVSQNQGQMTAKKSVAEMLNSSGRIMQPGSIIKADGSYAFISANDYNLIEMQNNNNRETSLLLLTHDKIISPLPSSLVGTQKGDDDDERNHTMQVLTMQPELQKSDIDQSNNTYPMKQSTRNVGMNKQFVRSMQQSEQDIEDSQIEIPKLMNGISGQSPLKSQNRQEQKNHQSSIITSNQKLEKRSLSKSNLVSHDQSLKAINDLRDQGSPQIVHGDLSSHNIQHIKDGKIYFTKKLKEMDFDEQSIFRVYTNDEQQSGIRVFETPSLSKETSQLGFFMAPADLSLNFHNLTSATTNATLIKPQISHLSPQKLTAFNLNDLSIGGKLNAKNIMMIKKFDLDHADSQLDFERDLEIQVDTNLDEYCNSVSEAKSQQLEANQMNVKSENHGKSQEACYSPKKKSKNQKRKLVASSTNNAALVHHNNNAGKRNNSRKVSQRRIVDDRHVNTNETMKRKASQSSNPKGSISDQQPQLIMQMSPNTNKFINLDQRKGKNGAPPLWLQNGVLVYPGTDQIDPILRNSTKNGNIPNNLKDGFESSSANRSKRSQNNGNSASKANMISPSTRGFNTEESEHLNQMLSRTVEKKSRSNVDSGQQTLEGIFMVDGQLIRLDKEGKIVQPIVTMAKDIPIHSVFEMNNTNKRDPQLTKMNQIHNKLKLMRGFNKSQARRNVREVPSVNKKNHQNYAQDGILEQRRVTNNSSKINAKQSKSAAKPTPTITYPYQNPYGQQAVDYLINVVKPLVGKNGQFPVNTDLQDILENSHRDRTLSPNPHRKSSHILSNTESKKPPMPMSVPSGSGQKVATKTPLKPSSSKFPDYSQSPMKVNELLMFQQRAQQNIVQTEKKQQTTKLQSLEAVKAQQIQQNNKKASHSNSFMQPQQLRSIPYRVQKSSSTHVKRSFTSLPEIKNKEQGKGQNDSSGNGSFQPHGQSVTSANRVQSNQNRQSNTQERGRFMEGIQDNSNEGSSLIQDKLLNDIQFGCQSDTMLSSINNDLAQIEKFQNDMFERTKFGDFVIYDNESKMLTFRSKNSKKASEVYLYQDLDFQELKKQLEAVSNLPAVGCNEVKMKDNSGKVLYQQPENAVLFDLYNTAKCKYSIIQGHKDQDRINQIRKKFGKLKNVKEFQKKLYIPNMPLQYCMFYARFESGNLQRVIQRNQGTQSMEYDLYLQPDTNSEGLMHWYYFKMMTKGLEPGTRIKLNIRNLHRSRSLYEQGMLPRICFEDTLQPNGNQGSGGDNFLSNLIGDSVSDEEAASASALSSESDDNFTQNGNRRVGWHIDPKVTYGINFFKTDQLDCFDPVNFCKDKQFYTLSFIYEVQQVNEAVFLAYDKPYTYSQDLKKFMDQVRNDPAIIDICQVSTLGKSMGGNDVRLLTITENVRHSLNFYESVKLHLKKDVRDRFSIKQEIEKMTEEQRKKKFLNFFKKPPPVSPNPIDSDRTILSTEKKDASDKKLTETDKNTEVDKKAELDKKAAKAANEVENNPEILTRPENAEIDIGIESKFQKHLIAHHGKNAMIITARVHPGEIQASFALEGVLRFLLSDYKKAKELRAKYIFYVVPMLNPDGVIHGNHRTDLAGFDMNRRWLEPSPWMHPIMYACKFLTRMVKEERQIDVFCDIHGHFQPTGGFAYCCSYYKPGHQIVKSEQENEANLRVIPQLIGQKNPLFASEQCTFNMEGYKNGSARQVMFNEFKILNSYTLENSFFSRFSDADIDALQEFIEARQRRLNLKKLKRSQSECSTNSSGEPREPNSANKKQGSCEASASKQQENVKSNKSVDKPFKIQEDEGNDYVDKLGIYQNKKGVEISLKKPMVAGRRAQNKESSLVRDKSSCKNLNLSLGEIGRSSSVHKQTDQEIDQKNSPEPKRPYPSIHHFSSFDHEKLGVDMCLIFHKLFIQSKNAGPQQEQAKEDINKIIAKYYSKLPSSKVPMANAQSISQAYGSMPPKFKR